MTDNTPPVLFMRARRGIVAESKRVVHVVPTPKSMEMPEYLTAYCRARIPSDAVELMAEPVGMPCVTCLAWARLGDQVEAPEHSMPAQLEPPD
jgi:hypothetical protein